MDRNVLRLKLVVVCDLTSKVKAVSCFQVLPQLDGGGRLIVQTHGHLQTLRAETH